MLTIFAITIFLYGTIIGIIEGEYSDKNQFETVNVITYKPIILFGLAITCIGLRELFQWLDTFYVFY